MVQINVTVYKLGSQSQRRFGISSGRRQKSRSWWGIAQSHQPITGDIGQTTAHERTLPLMQTPACNPVIMPNGQESQHAAGEATMDRQVGTQDTVPVLDHTTGSHSLVPSQQHWLGDGTPVGRQALEQVLARGTQDATSLPGPGQQLDAVRSQALTGAKSTRCGRAARSSVTKLFR